MSDIPQEGRRGRVIAAIEAFLQERLTAKIDKLLPDDPKRSELIAQHQRAHWLEDAARRVKQIQAVTHSLKPIHPDAKGTNLYVAPAQLHPHGEVGSHVLGEVFASDVVGNAAALDVYKLLKLEVDGHTLLDWMLRDDPAMLAALSDDEAQAQEWQHAFVGLTRPRTGGAASHAQAKQLYWLVGGDPTNDGAYHLLAPLYASSLAHAVYQVVQEDRFGEANKEARLARREQRAHAGTFRDYLSLAVQKLGGTKPQNISQLNSERGGNNYLLGSLPPAWTPRDVRMPWRTPSVFERIFGRRADVRETVGDLLRFLETDPDPVMATRNRVEESIATLIDELVNMAGELQRSLAPGWSRDERCQLADCERLWLDPSRAELPDEDDFLNDWLQQDWPTQVGQRFGNWLNQQLAGKLPVGDVEQRHWHRELLLDERDGGWTQQLHRQRRQLGAPTYIPVRKGQA